MNRRLKQCLRYYEQHSERLTFRIETKPWPTKIIKVYMPASVAELEKIYDEREEIMYYAREAKCYLIGD